MKILFIAPRYHTNQIPIINVLKKKKHNIFFLVEKKGFSEDFSEVLPKKIKIAFSISAYLNLYQIIKRIMPDIILIRFHNRFISYLSAILGRFCGSKIFFYEQADLNLGHLKIRNFRTLIRFVEFWTRLYLFNAKWYTPINNDFIKSKNRRIIFLPFTFLKRDKQNICRIIKKKFRILTIGKFQKRKNHLLLCKVVKKLSKKYDIMLTIIGEVKSSENIKNYNLVRNYITENNLEKKIKIIKNLKHKHINQYYMKNDFFVLPSTSEPAAISICEAMSFGLPVVLSNTSGSRCYVKNNKCGFHFKDNDLEDLSKKIEKMCNQNTISLFKKNLNTFFLKKYNQEKFYKSFLENIINDKKN